MQRGQRQLHQAAGGLDLTGLDVQALPFQGSEQLLDLPARLIPADDPQGLLDAGDIVAGQQAPVDRRLTGAISRTSAP